MGYFFDDLAPDATEHLSVARCRLAAPQAPAVERPLGGGATADATPRPAALLAPPGLG